MLSLTPRWTCVGFRKSLSRLQRLTVRGEDLVVYTPRHDLCVARDVCPHRGARLSDGCVGSDGVVCPRHGRVVNMMTDPELHFDVVVSQGVVWMCDGGYTTWAGPPTQLEFDSPDYRVSEFKKMFPDTQVSIDNILAFPRLFDMSFESTVRATAAGSVATYTTATPEHDIVIVNEFFAPSTTTIRFVFIEKATGRALPPLLVWFSLTPTTPGMVRLHARVCKHFGSSVSLTSWALDFINAAPLGLANERAPTTSAS